MAKRRYYRDKLGRFARKKTAVGRDKLGRFSRKKTAAGRAVSKRKQPGPSKQIRLPVEEISPAFRKYTKPVNKRQKRLVYAFVEVDKNLGTYVLDFLQEGETAVIPVIIGKFTRGQLSKLTESQVTERLRLVLPGTEIKRVAGFGHALTRAERRGMRFKKVRGRKTSKRAPKRNRRARKSSNSRRNKPARKKPKEQRSRSGIRH